MIIITTYFTGVIMTIRLCPDIHEDAPRNLCRLPEETVSTILSISNGQ